MVCDNTNHYILRLYVIDNEDAKQRLTEARDAGRRLDDFNAAMTEGRLKRGEGEYAAAAEAFGKALRVQGYSDNSEAVQALREVEETERNANNFSSIIDNGKRLYESKEYEAAIVLIQRALHVPGYATNMEAMRLLRDAERKALDARNFIVARSEGIRLYGAKQYEAAAETFRQALNIPGYADDPGVRGFLEEAEVAGHNVSNFASLLNEGMRLHEAEEYEAASEAFQGALNVPGYAENAEATRLLREARGKALDIRNFASAVNEGKRLYGMNRYDEAAAMFRQALDMPGHADDMEVRVLLREAEAIGYNDKNFASIMNEGMTLYGAKEYAAASDAFRQALGVPGYDQHVEARRLLEESDFAVVVLEGVQQFEAKEYDAAASAFQRALEMPGNERHHDIARQWLAHVAATAETAKRQAAEAQRAAAEEQQASEEASRNRDSFSAAVVDGRERYNEKDYAGAAAAFELALSIPGYADHAQAKRWLSAMRAEEAKETERRLAAQRAMEKASQAQAAAVMMTPPPASPVMATPPPVPTVEQVFSQPVSTAVEWFVIINGQSAGPFTQRSLRNEIVAGRVTRATSVWRDGMEGWAAAGDIPEIAPLFPAVPPIPRYAAAPAATQSPSQANNAPQPARSGGMDPEVKNILKGVAGTVLNELFKRAR